MSFLTFETAKTLGYPDNIACIIAKFNVPPHGIELIWNSQGEQHSIPEYEMNNL